jgi:hypothetical protein
MSYDADAGKLIFVNPGCYNFKATPGVKTTSLAGAKCCINSFNFLLHKLSYQLYKDWSDNDVHAVMALFGGIYKSLLRKDILTLQFKLYLSLSYFQVTVYRCEQMALDCSHCQALSKLLYSCYWGTNNKCVHNGAYRVSNCPSPNITEVCLFVCLFVYFGFYVTSTQYRSYRDIPALLVEENLRCPSVHYFRHERVPE